MCYLSSAFDSNYSEFPNSCRLGQLSLGIDAFEMLIHPWHCYLKKLRHQCLRKP